MKPIGPTLAFTCLALWFATGCASNKPGSNSHAYLQIKNQSTPAIVEATIAVYTAQGYELAAEPPGMLVFQRMASRRDALKYGDWINDGMLMEIKVRFTELTSTDMLLQADVYTVQDPNDPSFRSENRVAIFDRRPYQKMLDKVRDRLEKSSK
jgi:hypothetical protein